MRINLNDSKEFTLENVRKLIASQDDTVNTQFRVTNDGFLFLSKSIGNKDLEGIKFRLETNVAFNGYVGTEAAKNESWVKRIFTVVKNNWPKPTSTYIDTF
jgi:hypothetical protein